MAKKKRAASNINIDWYLISIDRLKQIALVLFLVLIGAGIWWYVQRERSNPRKIAENAISDARQALNSLASSKDLAQRRGDFDSAQKKLDEATAAFVASKYTEAQTAAVESQTISRTALSGSTGEENGAHFLSIEGNVEYSKGETNDFKKADTRTALINGDWVKTGDGASAEVMFQQNGSIFTVGPNALLEIYSSLNPATSKQTNAVQMQVGSVEVATSKYVSTVRTPSSQVVVDSEAVTQVGVDASKATSVIAEKGTASVTAMVDNKPADQAVKLSSGEKVSATPAGALAQVTKVLPPPALLTPPDNQVYTAGGEARVELSWTPQPGATGHQLQVSRSRLFSTVEINARRNKPRATAKVRSEGTFYWHVASIGPDGEIGPYSPFRHFRVSGGGNTSAAANTGDTTPPPLELKAPFGIGGQFYIIEGTTEPGATVFVNGEEADVESSGHFKKLVSFNKVGQNSVVVKAVDPAGNQTVKSQTVLVEE
jgi:hypothetical protein